MHVIEPLSLAYGGDIPMDLSTASSQAWVFQSDCSLFS